MTRCQGCPLCYRKPQEGFERRAVHELMLDYDSYRAMIEDGWEPLGEYYAMERKQRGI